MFEAAALAAGEAADSAKATPGQAADAAAKWVKTSEWVLRLGVNIN